MLRYRINVLEALKEHGWNTTKLRAENAAARARGEKSPGISEASIQALRESKPISWTTLEIICRKLNCQPGDLLEYIREDSEPS